MVTDVHGFHSEMRMDTYTATMTRWQAYMAVVQHGCLRVIASQGPLITRPHCPAFYTKCTVFFPARLYIRLKSFHLIRIDLNANLKHVEYRWALRVFLLYTQLVCIFSMFLVSKVLKQEFGFEAVRRDSFHQDLKQIIGEMISTPILTAREYGCVRLCTSNIELQSQSQDDI